MERESNQLEAGPILCRMGCGFFGSQNTDGLCSKCYKDALKKKNAPPSTVISPNSSSQSLSATTTSSDSPLTLHQVCSSSSSTNTTTGQPTVPILTQVETSVPGTPEKCAMETAGAEACDLTDFDGDAGSPDKDGAKKKKNKCQMCKKKVGLTGFTCRCGGLYCSVHRYSNEHCCTFDYREHGAEEIRRNNPVIKGEKIQKI